MNREEKRLEDKLAIFHTVTSKMMSKLHAYNYDLSHKHVEIEEHDLHLITCLSRQIVECIEKNIKSGLRSEFED